MSNSVRPHRWQPTRLHHPWDSPGKNTGVGCHFLLQCMKVKSESEVAQSCPTVSDPMDCSLPGSSVHGIFQAIVLEWGAIAFSILTATEAGKYWGDHGFEMSINCLCHGDFTPKQGFPTFLGKSDVATGAPQLPTLVREIGFQCVSFTMVLHLISSDYISSCYI